MKKSIQDSAELAYVCKLIDPIPIAMLTTIEPDGTLASRPLATLEMDAEGALWFFMDLRTSGSEDLRRVSLSFADTENGTYVSLSGRGEIDADRDRIRRLWTSFARPWVSNRPDSPELVLFKFIPDAIDYWDGPKCTMVRAASRGTACVAR